MANSPVLWGPNNTAINLQNQELLATGEVLTNNGPQNLIGYNNFANGLTTGYALGTTGTLTNGIPTGTPTFGSGAAGTLAITATATTPMNAPVSLYDLLYADSAATTAGNMVHTSALAVPTGMQAKVLTFKVMYRTVSGTINFSGTSSNSYGIAAYDVTNSVWLPVAGNFSMTQGTGVGLATGTFQTNATTASIRFCIYNVSATGGAASIALNGLYLGPQTAPIGPVVTDWVAYTPTGSWVSNATYSGFWRRNGSNLEVTGRIDLAGAPTAANLTVNLPSGFTMDTNKIQLNGLGTNLGGAYSVDTGVAGYPGVVLQNTTTSVGIYSINASTTYGIGNFTSSTVPFTFGSTDLVSYYYSVPIVGWSSNVQMSNDTDTRVVAFSAGLVTGGSVSVNTVVKYDSVITDTHGAYSTSTGLYTVPVTGIYRISTSLLTNTAGAGLYVSVSGSGKQYVAATPVANQLSGGSTTYSLVAGQTVSLFTNATATFTSSSAPVFLNFISIERLTGPSVIAATESVNMQYFSTAGTAMSAGVDTAIPFGVKQFDSHNAYSGSTFTVPVSGKYEVAAVLQCVSTIYAIGDAILVILYKNGSPYTYGPRFTAQTITSIIAAASIDTSVSCNAGDTLQIYINNGKSSSLLTTSGLNHIEIERVGQ